MLGFFRFNATKNMVSKIIKELRSKDRKNIPSILMLLDQFQVDEVIKDDSKIAKNTMELVYLLFFHLITSLTDVGIRKVWVFFTRGWLGFLSQGSLGYDRQKSEP